MSPVQLRPLRPSDVPELVGLCEQLGWPATAPELEERFERLRAVPGQAVFVAEREAGGIVGWMHVQERPALHLPHTAEVAALVVDAAHRGTGCGRALMAEAEGWARARGCQMLMLRSSSHREAAHRFYEALGYERASSSFKFTRTL
ncbi:GNAT family N-acetyltransferase [Corallococcus llansteffanensis]|nr:GNAT family N-acetyltransferase [Corallococcus llansteffanensis]